MEIGKGRDGWMWCEEGKGWVWIVLLGVQDEMMRGYGGERRV